MGRHCIVHIGPHKTGTSSIQQTLFHELQSDVFEYAKLGSANQGNRLHLMISAEPEENLHAKRNGLTPMQAEHKSIRYSRDFNRALARTTCPNIVFSGEAQSAFSLEEVHDLRRLLANHFDRMTIVGYVRPPRALMQSTFQQRAKVTCPPLAPRKLYRSYRNTFEKFDHVFGKDNCWFWRFHRGDFPNGDVVVHFFASLGIPLPDRLRHANESLSCEAVQILYAHHKLTEQVPPQRGLPLAKKWAAGLLSGIRGKKFRLSSALLDPAIAANRDDIAWAEERIGASLAEEEEADSVAIASEQDLLDIPSHAIAALEEIVSAHCSLPGRSDEPPVHAANLVKALILHRMATASGARRGDGGGEQDL
jgi:hypothetical protein